MGILDDAIRQHLDLKRSHGADDSELEKIEAEAFGPPARPGDSAPAPDLDENAEFEDSEFPDPEAEAPTQFLGSSVPAPSEEAETADHVQEDSFDDTSSDADEHEIPSFGESPAGSVPPPPPTLAEREAIAEQPTQFYDFESDITAAEESPSADDLYEERLEEPRLAPSEPMDEDSLSPIEPVDEPGLADPEDGRPDPAGPDSLSGDALVQEPGADDPFGEGDVTIEKAPETDEQFFDESSLSDELDRALEPSPEADPLPEPPAGPSEDVLEETPEFLQDTPEDERLWFEQKPPKDFDFDE